MINLFLLLIIFCIVYAIFHGGEYVGGMVSGLRDVWCQNIQTATLNNTNYRKVEHTTKNMQLVTMNLKPGEEIGMERHPSTTQFIRIEKGTGMATVRGVDFPLENDTAIIIPPNSLHNIKNTGTEDMRLYTIYTPPEHREGLVQSFRTP
jgi:mannose-6-phosphate isomerase-like protein (cupin superfamily)